MVGTKVAARRSTVWPCSTTPSEMMVPSPMVSAIVSTLHTAAGVSFSDTSVQLARCELDCDDVPPLGVLGFGVAQFQILAKLLERLCGGQHVLPQ